MSTPPIAIIGCTGSGKGALGRAFARRVGGEIISLDSMKVYRRMDVGTAKPSKEILAEIPHHLVDVVEPSEDFSVASYIALAEAAMSDIQDRSKPVIFIGGTVLYLKALTEGLFEGPGADEAIRKRLRGIAESEGSGALHRRLGEVDAIAADRIHVNDLRRIIRALEIFELTGRPISELQEQWDTEQKRHEFLLFGLRRELEDQNHRTNERVRRMIEAGLVDEVRGLLCESAPLSKTARQAVGYAEIIKHLEGEVSLADAIEMIKINTRQFAKSQRTWLRRFRDLEWVDLQPESDAEQIVTQLLRRRDWPWSTSLK